MCKHCMLTSKSQILFESHSILMKTNSKILCEYSFWHYFCNLLKFNIIVDRSIMWCYRNWLCKRFAPGTKTSFHCFFHAKNSACTHEKCTLDWTSTSNIIFFQLSLEHISNIAKCTAINCEFAVYTRMRFSLIQFVMHYITGIEPVPCIMQWPWAGAME